MASANPLQPMQPVSTRDAGTVGASSSASLLGAIPMTAGVGTGAGQGSGVDAVQGAGPGGGDFVELSDEAESALQQGDTADGLADLQEIQQNAQGKGHQTPVLDELIAQLQSQPTAGGSDPGDGAPSASGIGGSDPSGGAPGGSDSSAGGTDQEVADEWAARVAELTAMHAQQGAGSAGGAAAAATPAIRSAA